MNFQELSNRERAVYFGQISGGGFVDQYTTLYDQYTEKPPFAIAVAQNTLVQSLVNNGLWTGIDSLLVFAGHTSLNGESWIDWKVPTRSAVPTADLDFIAYGGIEPDGVNDYLDTKYNFAVDAVSASQNDVCEFIGVRNDVASDNYDSGILQGTGYFITRTRRSTNQVNAYLNSSAISVLGTATNSKQHYCFVRDGASSVKGYVKDAETSDIEASTGLPNGDHFIGGYNNGSGVLAGEVSKRYLYRGIASAFSAAEWTTFWSIMETYLLTVHSPIYITGEGSYPTKTAQISWVDDDGKDSFISVLQPLLDPYGYKASLGIITDNIDVGDNLTTAEILSLYNAGHEILSHTEDHADLATLNDAQIIQELSGSLSALESIVGAGNVRNFVYPGGSWNTLARERAIDYYRSALGVTGFQKYPVEYGNLDRMSVDTSDLATMQGWVDDAVSDGTWLCLYGHSNGWDATQQSRVSDLIDYINAQGVAFRTIDDALNVVETYHPGQWLTERFPVQAGIS